MPRSPVFVVLVTLLSTAAATARAESLAPDEQELTALVNQARMEAGLAPLQADAGLAAVARAHSLDMATTGFFSHSSPTTGELTDRLAAARVDFAAAGENIAVNSTVRAAHEGLLRSPAHRQNLLSPDFTHVGVGVVSNGRTRIVTETFLRAGARFQTRIPTIDPVVSEARPDEVRRITPPTVAAVRDEAGCVEEASDCVEWDEDEEGEEGEEGGQESAVDVAPGPTPITIVPGTGTAWTAAPHQIPVIQARPLPVPAPPRGPIPNGVWILGPNGNWMQVRMQPPPLHRRVVVPQPRFLY